MMTMQKYSPNSECGFCQQRACDECELRLIRECLEKIANSIEFDHDHKYRQDNDEFVRVCAHCEYGYTIESRYELNDLSGEVNCGWNHEKMGEDYDFPVKRSSDVCEHWKRAKEKN